MSMLVGSQKRKTLWREGIFLFAFIFLVTLVFPNVFLYPSIVFGYGGSANGGGGGSSQTSQSQPSSDESETPESTETPENTTVSSSQKSITSFTISEQVGETTIDTSKFVIRLQVAYGAAVTALVPSISFDGRAVSPGSGVAQDFTRPRIYTVTAEDGSAQEYMVIVDHAPKKQVEDPNSIWFQETVQRTDMVRDGEIDIYDFNTLMVHWSDPSDSNPADVNGDKTVDVFDFNLLMIHWGKIET